MMKSIVQKCWPYLVALLVFVAISCIYMSPVLDGKVIAASDSMQGRAANHECVAYTQQTGDHSWWIGSMFSGMPNYQIGGGQNLSDAILAPVRHLLQWGHRSPLAIVLIYCIGFFILVRSLKVDKWVAIVGALAIAFSSYFFVIIAACHNSKTSTLALMSVALAGFYLIFHGHRKSGVCLSMLGTLAGFYPHPQMAYYVCWIFAAFGVAELCVTLQNRLWRPFCLNCLLALAALGIGVSTGMSSTFVNLEYAEETMRGGQSDLVKATDGANKTKGLDLDYATAWSYGIDECWTFLVPNYMGGSSNYPIGEDSQFCQDLIKKGVSRSQARQIAQSAPIYWGKQPFTSGPVYMGALVCLLFVLSLFIVKGPYKWALLVVTLLSVALSWGHNWMGLTRFFFDYVPMYNKFRAVSSILVIAEITMPLMGFLALQRLIEGKQEGRDYGRQLLCAAGTLVALLLVCLLTTSGFTGTSDAQMPEWLLPMLQEARASLFRADLWRALGLVLLCTGVLWFYIKSVKFQSTALLALCLGALVVFDMWPVDKRFMNDTSFSAGNSFDKAFKAQAWEHQILEAEGMKAEQPVIVTDNHFRVYNLTMNPFNDARTSYRLKSIGGYSAAKLRRYQDLIEQHIGQMHYPVIDMLNARYFIVPDRANGNAAVVQKNPNAMGNAWFVADLQVAASPNEECDGLMQVDLHRTALVGKDFADQVANLHPGIDSTAVVRLTQYRPEQIEYSYTTSQPSALVFSEIYYPHGWKVTIDGEPASHYRVNYLLRGMDVPAGSHTIRFLFEPDSVRKGDYIGLTAIVLMCLIFLGCVGKGIRDLIR